VNVVEHFVGRIVPLLKTTLTAAPSTGKVYDRVNG